MSANNASTVQWVCSELSKLLGADTDEAVAGYLLSISSPHELEEYMGEILDTSKHENRTFVQELLRKRWGTSSSAGDAPVPSAVPQDGDLFNKRKDGCSENSRSKSDEVFNSLDKLTSKKTPKRYHAFCEPKTETSHTDKHAGIPSDSSYLTSPGAKSKSATKSTKTKFVPLFSPEGNDRTVAKIPGRHVCECQAAKHALVNNCLCCGRVVCEQEGSGPCFFCGNLVCNKEEQEILVHSSKKSERLRNHLMSKAVPAAESVSANQSDDVNDDLAKAVAFRDRLLEYDKSSVKRTHVIDDESDYFSVDNNQWLPTKQREALRKKKEELLAQRYGSRRDKKITIDLAGRNVVSDRGVDNMYDPSNLPVELENGGDANRSPEIRPEDFAFDLVNSTLNVPAPQFVPQRSEQKRSTLQSNAKTEGVKNVRLQDSELQLMSDEGVALSMHQPWASLLVAGIKQHEGRTWYTTHRGILWIASTAKKPDPTEIHQTEAFYRQFYNDQQLPFPTSYPSGCLLGCVNVVDCLSQEDYREQFPDGESESPYVFICKNPRELVVKFPVKGQHKIYKLDRHIHQAAKKCVH